MGEITVGYIGAMLPEYLTTKTEEITASDESNISRASNRVYAKPLVLKAGEEIFYNSYELLSTLHKIGFTDDITAKIIVREKKKD